MGLRVAAPDVQDAEDAVRIAADHDVIARTQAVHVHDDHGYATSLPAMRLAVQRACGVRKPFQGSGRIAVALAHAATEPTLIGAATAEFTCHQPHDRLAARRAAPEDALQELDRVLGDAEMPGVAVIGGIAGLVLFEGRDHQIDRAIEILAPRTALKEPQERFGRCARSGAQCDQRLLPRIKEKRPRVHDGEHPIRADSYPGLGLVTDIWVRWLRCCGEHRRCYIKPELMA